jgi:hypothetical protein
MKLKLKTQTIGEVMEPYIVWYRRPECKTELEWGVLARDLEDAKVVFAGLVPSSWTIVNVMELDEEELAKWRGLRLEQREEGFQRFHERLVFDARLKELFSAWDRCSTLEEQADAAARWARIPETDRPKWTAQYVKESREDWAVESRRKAKA